MSLPGVCALLIEKGAQVNNVGPDGSTPLLTASYRGLFDVCKLLIQKGANINAKHCNGKTALAYFLGFSPRHACKFLIDKGANVNAQYSNGDSLLMLRVKQEKKDAGFFPIISFLLDNGADVHVKNNKGDTPLSLALSKGGGMAEESFDKDLSIDGLLLAYAMILPETDDLTTSQEIIETVLLCFQRLSQLSKDIQYLILQKDEELEKHLIKAVVGYIKKGHQAPEKLQSWLATKIRLNTIAHLKPQLEQTFINLPAVEKYFAPLIQKNILKRLKSPSLIYTKQSPTKEGQPKK